MVSPHVTPVSRIRAGQVLENDIILGPVTGKPRVVGLVLDTPNNVHITFLGYRWPIVLPKDRIIQIVG